MFADKSTKIKRNTSIDLLQLINLIVEDSTSLTGKLVGHPEEALTNTISGVQLKYHFYRVFNFGFGILMRISVRGPQLGH